MMNMFPDSRKQTVLKGRGNWRRAARFRSGFPAESFRSYPAGLKRLDNGNSFC